MTKEANYLFLGGLFPKETEKEIFEKSTGSVQNAANVFQWNIVKGLDEILFPPIKILNSLYIGSYPRRYKDLFVPSYRFQHTDGADDYNVGFCNLTGYKQFSRKNTLARNVKKWIKGTPGEKYIFAYAMTETMVNALHVAKKMDPNIVTCLIVPDLPQFMNMGKKLSIKNILKKFDIAHQKSRYSSIDGFVFLTKQMNEKVGASKFIVVEGIARDAFVARQTEERLQKTILYTGGLNQKYGITTLVDAFMQIEDPEYRLILCGSGDAVPYINNAQRKDSRIEYKGLVRHDETLSLQMKATVLVNPRQNTEEFTKYSFPSKNLEYLASGTPVIAYKLDGIPDEYDDYFLYVSDNSVAALRNKIEEVCSLSEQERIRFGQRARRFVLEEKNCEKQAQRMLDFVRSIRFP